MAPQRYATWISAALYELNHQQLEDITKSHNWCFSGDYYWTIHLSQAFYNYTLDHDSIIIQITDYGFYTSGQQFMQLLLKLFGIQIISQQHYCQI